MTPGRRPDFARAEAAVRARARGVRPAAAAARRVFAARLTEARALGVWPTRWPASTRRSAWRASGTGSCPTGRSGGSAPQMDAEALLARLAGPFDRPLVAARGPE